MVMTLRHIEVFHAVCRNGSVRSAARAERLAAFGEAVTGTLVERFCNKLKHFRGVATRCDKRAGNYLAASTRLSENLDAC